jgi:RTX calcium-binding nonapeptide repeat (4 copies)
MVAELSNGNIVVAYVDVTTNTLQGRIFNTTTNIFGAAIALHGPSNPVAASPNPALQPGNLIALSGGGFVVSYVSSLNGGYLTFQDNSGASVGASTIVNSGIYSNPALVQLVDGNVMALDWNESFLFINRYTSGGFYINGFAITLPGVTSNQFHNLRATALLDGRVMVVGSSLVEGAVAGSDIWGQVINANGTPDGAAFRINGDNLAGTQTAPDIATLADGRVVVTWTDHNVNSGDIMQQIIDIRSTGVNLVGTGSLNDTWIGSRFNDTMEGGLGNDVLDGGAGTGDVISFAGYAPISGMIGIFVNLGLQSGAQNTGSGNDTFTNFEHLTGSAYNDRLIGDTGDNIIRGGAGDDDLRGGNGTNQLFGDGGDDYLVTGSSNTVGAVYDGGADTDELYLSADGTSVFDFRDDTLLNLETLAFGSPAPPNTTARFNASQFTQFQTIEAQGLAGQMITIDITMGAQTSLSLASLAIIGMTEPNDRFIISGDANAENIIGSSVNDTIAGGAGADIIDGGGGNDTITFADASTVVIIHLDTPTQYAQWGSGLNGSIETDILISIEKATGGSGADYLYGDGNANVLVGNGENDYIAAGAGADIIFGGSGQEFIDASNGSDNVSGGDDGDVIYGGADNDILNGDDGRDLLYGDHGADSLFGGNGIDVLFVDSTDIAYDGGADIDYIVWQDVAVAANMNLAVHSADYFYGYTGNDIVFATGATTRVELHGGDGGDTLVGGGSGGSILLGEGGVDRLVSEIGIDHMVGGADADRFVFSPNGGVDYIYDFNGTQGDRIEFSVLAASNYAGLTVNTSFAGIGWYGYSYGSGTVWANTTAVGGIQPLTSDFVFV